MEDCKLLSIIIPAYNVEQYLARCVDSCEAIDVRNEDLEIIIIDDGSADGTMQVAKECAKRYSNIDVVSQANQGQSVARNEGIKRAKGKYLWFVDSDDYVKTEGVAEVLNQCLKHNIEIAFFRMSVETPDGKSYLSNLVCKDTDTILCGRDVILSGFCGGSVCNSLYSKKFLKDNDLQFFPGIIHQDCELSVRAVALAKSVMQFDVPLYVYFYNSQSCTRSNDYKKRRKACLSDVIIANNLSVFASKIENRQLRVHFRKMSNSIIVSSFLTQMRMRSGDGLLRELFREVSATTLYPIKGRTLSWKTTLLISIVNCGWLMRRLVKCDEKR